MKEHQATALAVPEIATVTVSERGVSVQPQHTYVKVRGAVGWTMSIAPKMKPLRVTVYFRDKSPFNWSSRDAFASDNTNTVVISAAAMTTGDYKYGVQVSERDSGRLIGDDDPYIHVVAE
jgi:hypothetical protein